jgi:energy-coupling factor transporter ATP-binding protein EcfA2
MSAPIIQVLDRLDWQIRPGQVVGLLGRNGAGKSTLLECMRGLRGIQAGTVSCRRCSGAAGRAACGSPGSCWRWRPARHAAADVVGAMVYQHRQPVQSAGDRRAELRAPDVRTARRGMHRDAGMQGWIALPGHGMAHDELAVTRGTVLVAMLLLLELPLFSLSDSVAKRPTEQALVRLAPAAAAFNRALGRYYLMRSSAAWVGAALAAIVLAGLLAWYRWRAMVAAPPAFPAGRFN